MNEDVSNAHCEIVANNMYPIYITDQIRIPIMKKKKLKKCFLFFKERQKELETYNIYSERFLRGLTTRRTGKRNIKA